MTGLFLIAYVVGPVLMLVCLLGCGLLVRRVAGGGLPTVFVLPLGFAAVIAVGAFLTTWDATAELTGPAFVGLALAGLALERRSLRVRLQPVGRWAYAAGAAVVAYAVMIAPALLSGRATFTGYARIVDLAHQFDFATYLVSEGRLRPPARDTSFTEVVTKTVDIGYPGGGQSAFGGFASLLGTDLVWIYQGFLAVTAAMLALAVYALLRGAIASRPLRGLAAAIAAQANVLVGYGLVGGFKELVTAALIVLLGALVREVVPARGSPRAMVPLAVATAGGLGAFNLTAVPWIGLVLGGFFVVTMARGRLGDLGVRLRPLGSWAAMAVMTLALAAPTVAQGFRLAPVAAQAAGGIEERTAIADLGNLAAPIPVKAATGVWITGDYRLPQLGDTAATSAVIAVVLALAVVGLVSAARRRDWSLLLLGGAAAVATAYFAARTGPWIQLKAISMTGPIVLAVAFAGAAALARWLPARRGLAVAAGWGLAGVVALGVVAGNANAYHDITLAPTERLLDLKRIGERFAGVGPALYHAHEEYAEYFLRDSRATAFVNAPGEGLGFPQYQPGAAEEAAEEATAGYPRQVWDPDDLAPTWLQGFELVVLRRGPEWSRPPSNYVLAHQTRFHEVWRKVRPSQTVLAHVPLPGWDDETTDAACKDLVRRADRAQGEVRVAYARRSPSVEAELDTARYSPNWQPALEEALIPYGPGWAERDVRIPREGTYRLWIKGPTQRELRLLIDGRQVASFANAWSYPGQWTLLKQVRVRGGRHALRLERSGGSLAPGDGAGGQPVGPVVFELATPRAGQVRTAPAERARDLCAEREGLDWIELVRPAGAPEQRPVAVRGRQDPLS